VADDETIVAGTPPNVTVALFSDVPLTVTVLPTKPDVGVIEVIAGALYVNVPDAERPSGFVMTSGFEPDVPPGSVNEIDVGVTVVTGAALPPTVTVAPLRNSLPLTVTVIPPDVGPLGGETPEIVGEDSRVNGNGLLALPLDDTTIVALPGPTPAGIVTCICVPLIGVNAAAMPVTVAESTELSEAPLSVTTVPTPPDVGEMLAIEGALYVNGVGLNADRASGLVSTIDAGPEAPIGGTKVMLVGVTVVTVAGLPATVTVAPVTKSLPFIVTLVPPVVGPLLGVMLVITGLEMTVNVSALLLNEPDVAMTACDPGVNVGTTAWICVALRTVWLAETPPKVTVLTELSDAPFRVTVVPLVALEGTIEDRTGELYVKVPLTCCPSGLVMTSGVGPEAPLGAVNVMDVADTDVTVAGAPTVTVAPARNSVPVTVTLYPPCVPPLDGVTELIVGLERRWKNAALLVDAPDVANTGWLPGGVPAGTVA
jgi:hypothetical protein